MTTAPTFLPVGSCSGDGHVFYGLNTTAVIRETDEAISIVLGVPTHLRDVFAYRAGQFVTVRIEAKGETHLRSYSMSSAPGIDGELQVTVKRVPGGVVSNWIVDHVREGHVLQVNAPAGAFVLDEGDSDVVAFAAGSGITPVFSILKTVLAKSSRRLRLLYADRDRSSTIFADALSDLAAEHPDRLHVEHHFDEQRGFIDGSTVSRFVGQNLDAEFFICGPTPFMDTVDATLMWSGVRRQQVHIERFTPSNQGPPAGKVDGIEVTVTLGGKTVTTSHRSKATILQTAETPHTNPRATVGGTPSTQRYS